MTRIVAPRLWSDDAGVTAIEYALIGGCVAAGLVGAFSELGSWLTSVYVALSAAFH